MGTSVLNWTEFNLNGRAISSHVVVLPNGRSGGDLQNGSGSSDRQPDQPECFECGCCPFAAPVYYPLDCGLNIWIWLTLWTCLFCWSRFGPAQTTGRRGWTINHKLTCYYVDYTRHLTYIYMCSRSIALRTDDVCCVRAAYLLFDLSVPLFWQRQTLMVRLLVLTGRLSIIRHRYINIPVGLREVVQRFGSGERDERSTLWSDWSPSVNYGPPYS